MGLDVLGLLVVVGMLVVVIIRIQPRSGLLHSGCQAKRAGGSMRFNANQVVGEDK